MWHASTCFCSRIADFRHSYFMRAKQTRKQLMYIRWMNGRWVKHRAHCACNTEKQAASFSPVHFHGAIDFQTRQQTIPLKHVMLFICCCFKYGAQSKWGHMGSFVPGVRFSPSALSSLDLILYFFWIFVLSSCCAPHWLRNVFVFGCPLFPTRKINHLIYHN